MSAAMDWLETNYDHDAFFLYVDMWDPHEPFDCPWYDYALYADPDYDGDQITYPQYGRFTYMTPEEHANVRALYAGQVTLVDRWVGRFLELAERLGLFEDTLIIWTTDHGHLFGEHGLQGKPGARASLLQPLSGDGRVGQWGGLRWVGGVGSHCRAGDDHGRRMGLDLRASGSAVRALQSAC